jgi:hypothetical protein
MDDRPIFLAIVIGDVEHLAVIGQLHSLKVGRLIHLRDGRV